MKIKFLILVLFAIAILIACVPKTSTPVAEATQIITPSAPSAIDLGILGHGMAKAAAWSADGKMLAVMSTRGIYLYNSSTWRVESLIEIQSVENITQFWFHPNGKSLYYTLLTSPYLSVYIYDLAGGGGKHLYQDFTFLSPATFIFSADGRMFANIGKMETNERGESSLAPQIEIREMTTGKVLQTLDFNVKWWGTFPVELASFSPDGSLFAAGGTDNLVRVWDIQNGLLLFEKSHDADVKSLVFSPDGKMLVSTGDDATVRFWDAHTGELIFLLRKFKYGLTYLAYSMKGSELLLGQSDGNFQQWKVDANFLPVAQKDSGFKSHRYIYTQIIPSYRLNPAGDQLAVVDNANLKIFNLTEKNQSIVLPEFNAQLKSIEFNPDGSVLALVGQDVHLWDVQSRKALGTLSASSYSVNDIDFSPDGKQIAVSSGNIEIWDVVSLQKITEIDEGSGLVAYSPDGSWLATGGWYHVTIHDLESGKEIQKFKTYFGVPYALSFSADGKKLILIAENKIRMWDIASGKLIQSVDKKPLRIDRAVFFHSGDRVLLESFISCMDGGVFDFWDFGIGKSLYSLTVPMCAQGHVAIHPSQKLIAHATTANESSEIYLKDIFSGQHVLNISVPSRWVDFLNFSPRGEILAAMDSDKGIVYLWDITRAAQFVENFPSLTATPLPTQTFTPTPTPAIAAEIPSPRVTPPALHPNGITNHTVKHLAQVGTLGGSRYNSNAYTAAWSADGKRFALGNLGAVHVYMVGKNSPEQSFAGGDLVENLVFSPSGKYLIEQNNKNKAIVWDLTTGKRTHTFEQNCRGGKISLSADESALTIDCWSNAVQIFDMQSGKLVSKTAGGRYGNYSPDGNLLVMASSTYAYLIDAQTETILYVFESKGSLWRASFSPDGQTLLVWKYAVPSEKMMEGEMQMVYDESVAELWRILPGQEPMLYQIIKTGKLIQESIAEFAQYDGYVFTSDGKKLITAVGDGFVRIWDTHTGILLGEIKAGSQLYLSPDDRRLITFGTFGLVQVWDLSSIHTPRLLYNITDFQTWSYTCPISFTGNGGQIMLASNIGIEKWDLSSVLSNSKHTTYPLEQRSIFAANLDGSYWATGDFTGSVMLRDPHNGKALQTMLADSEFRSGQPNDRIDYLAFSNSGDILAAATYWHVWLWNAKTREMLFEFQSDFPIGDLTLGPDGRLLAVSENNNGTAEIWDTQTGQRLRHFDFAGQQIAFSPDGLTLATAWREGTIWLLDITTGQMTRSVQVESYVWDITFNPDGSLLAALTSDGVQFLDVASSTVIKSLKQISLNAQCINFSPDGAFFAVSGMESPIKLWSIPTP